MEYISNTEGAQQLNGNYSIIPNLRNADIGGAKNNPRGFRYEYTDMSGLHSNIDAAFYVVSDDGIRSSEYGSLLIDDIWRGLRANIGESWTRVGNNNLEMVFKSTEFQTGPIDVIYIPFNRMEWQEDNYIPDYPLDE